MNNRIEYLSHSLIIEKSVSWFLATCLGIEKDVKNSKSFSNKSSALTLMQKVNLILDLEIIEKKSIWKFEMFMSIRNQFMHNSEAETYEQCIEFIDGAKTKILKEYGEDKNLTTEQNLQLAANKLAIDVKNICELIYHKSLENYFVKGYIAATITKLEAFEKAAAIWSFTPHRSLKYKDFMSFVKIVPSKELDQEKDYLLPAKIAFQNSKKDIIKNK